MKTYVIILILWSLWSLLGVIAALSKVKELSKTEHPKSEIPWFKFCLGVLFYGPVVFSAVGVIMLFVFILDKVCAKEEKDWALEKSSNKQKADSELILEEETTLEDNTKLYRLSFVGKLAGALGVASWCTTYRRLEPGQVAKFLSNKDRHSPIYHSLYKPWNNHPAFEHIETIEHIEQIEESK